MAWNTPIDELDSAVDVIGVTAMIVVGVIVAIYGLYRLRCAMIVFDEKNRLAHEEYLESPQGRADATRRAKEQQEYDAIRAEARAAHTAKWSPRLKRLRRFNRRWDPLFRIAAIAAVVLGVWCYNLSERIDELGNRIDRMPSGPSVEYVNRELGYLRSDIRDGERRLDRIVDRVEDLERRPRY